MKSKKKKIIIAIVILILIICAVYIALKINKADIVYDNETSYDELITYRYSDEELYNIFSDTYETLLDWQIIHLFDVVKKKNIECARYITDDYRYVILKSDSDNKLFIFFSGKYVINNVYYVQGDFLEQKDYEFVEAGETRLDEVEGVDINKFLSPHSYKMMTQHIVKEGVYHVTYKDMNRHFAKDGDFSQDFAVDEIVFYENDELFEKWQEHYFWVPYILPMDKQ